jgi:chromosome segregation ATPase
MARREAKARTKAVPVPARVVRGKDVAEGEATLQQRLAAVERERDALREELERCEAHMRRLEENQLQVRDRIAWALDSLHDILDKKAT